MPNPNNLMVPQELIVLGASVETGIIELLKSKSLTDKEIAGNLKLNSRATWTVLEALVAIGYVTRVGKKYRLSNIAKTMFYNPKSKEYTGFSFMHRYTLVKRWASLPEIMKTGEPYAREFNPKETHYFIEAMAHGAKQSGASIAQFLLRGQKRGVSVLDIGGGPLIHAGEFSKRGAQVTVQDLEDVVKMNQKKAKQLKIRMVPGDFKETLPKEKYDLAYLGNICHIIGEKENQDLFQRVSKILNPKGRIAIVEFIRDSHPWGALFAVNMLVNTPTGGTYTLDEYTEWLEKAGFQKVRLHSIAERQVIIAIKK